MQLSGLSGNEPLDDNPNAVNDKLTVTGNEDNTERPPQPEPHYQPIYSRMVDMIEEHADNGNEPSMFQYPDKYWSNYTLINVKWVSLRLRCLLESLIRISNLAHIDGSTLTAIKEAFEQLASSASFTGLTSDYPYTAFIKELRDKITQIAKQYKHHSSVMFRISPHLKAKIIAKRYLLADYVPAIRFSELDFNEKATYPIK